MTQAARSIELPAPSRAGWRFMMVSSAAVALLGGGLLLNNLDALHAEPMSAFFVLLGAGLFLSCFAALMLYSRQPAARLQIAPERAALRLLDGRGAQVDLPADSLLGAITPMNPSDGRGHVVALRKRDGGLLELTTAPTEQEASELADEITAAISALQQPPETAEPAGDNPYRGEPGSWAVPSSTELPDITGVTARREGEALVLSWPAGRPLRSLLGAGCPLGLGVVGVAGLREDGGVMMMLFVGFCLTLAIVIVASVLVTQGVRAVVRVSQGNVTIDKTRFGRVAHSQQLPIAAIKAVDYAHQLNASGTGLSLRSARLDGSLDQLAEADNAKDAFSAALALMQGIGAGVTVPCGNLPLASKVALDMLLSRELAQRSARMPSEL